MILAESSAPCRYLIHDHDTMFIPFDNTVETDDIDIVKTPKQKPWSNGFAERFIRKTRETLDNLILIGPQQLHAAMKKIERHHNRHRPHQSIDNLIPLGYEYPDAPADPGNVRCDSQLGGLLNHYYVKHLAA